jgi:integrase
MASIRPRILPSGTKVFLCDYVDTNGKRRAKQFPRRKDADAFLVGARGQIRDGTYVHDADSLTVRQATDLWFDHIDARVESGRRMERATAADYKAKMRLHILDEKIGIGKIKLSRLSRREVNELVDALLKNGRETATVRKALGKLKLFLAWCQDNGRATQNVAAGVRVIGTTRLKQLVEIPSRDAIKSLLKNAADDFRPLLLVTLFCGLRSSEARALTWGDVDLKGSHVHVRRRVDRYGAVGEPKSAAGTRSIPIGPKLVAALRRWKLRCPKTDEHLVFPSKSGTYLDHSNLLSYYFRPLCKKLEVMVTWHALRHYCVSSWIAEGFGIKAIMTWAGHSSVAMTMDLYGHLFPSPDHHVGMASVEKKLLA